MCWFKREMWKTGIAIAGMLLLLVLMVWVPVSVASARVASLELAATVIGMAQATPTEDATVTALNKEKLAQEVQQLKNQNEPDPLGWLRTNASILLSTLIVVIGGLIGLYRWFGDRRSEREKRAEERFQAAVTGLGDEKEGPKIGAAILLRTFLRPSYEQFYTQTFDLAVANLRLPRASLLSEDQDRIPHSPEDPNTPLPLTTLSQALIVVFKEAFPLVRGWIKKRQMLESSFLQRIKAWLKRTRMEGWFDSQSLDATGIQLDNAYLRRADLKQAWMPQASLRNVDLSEANLSEANLQGADLSKTNLEYAKSLKGTDLRKVKGLTKEQLAICEAMGAIIDEDSITSSSQSPISPSSSSQSNDVQVPSAPSAQGSISPPDTGGSGAASSELGSQS